MKPRVRLVALTALMTLAAGWLAEAPAAAAMTQVFHTQVNVRLTNIRVCGFKVDSVIQGTDTFQLFSDANGNVSVQDVSHVVSTLTNRANGKVVYVDNASRDSLPAPVVNADGTITVTDTLTGSPERVYTSHSDVLVKDVGFVSLVDTVDARASLLSEQVIVHGGHQASGEDAGFCAAISSALQ
jgi:hypothetical protein